MTSSRINNDDKKQALGEALEFAKEIEQKIQEFNSDSAKTAEKWQKKVEHKLDNQ